MIDSNTIVGGRYKVLHPLGGGGMKLVYLAEDLRLASRPCALAEMVDSFTSPDMQKQAVAAFQREADMLAQLSNEHIPRVFDRFSEENHHYLVMEYIDGITLEDELKADGGKMPEAQLIDIALQILDTLNYLHNLEPPVIYRDLKPSNVMIGRNAQAKLIDFGIARHFQPQSNATMIGTQGYAPPEQYRGRVEARSDLYALGATMHHALSGRDPALEPPFSFPPLRSLCPQATPGLCELIDDALKYDVVLRVPDAAEFKRRLLEIRDGRAYPPAAGDAQPGPTTSQPRSQLKLPLSKKPAATPSAPTMLSDAIDAACPRCARKIPIDSNFCSFCAANVTGTLGLPANPAAQAEARTIVLDEVAGPGSDSWSQSQPSYDFETEEPPLRRRRRTVRPRHLTFFVVMLFLVGFFSIRYMQQQQDDSPPDSGSSYVPPAVPSAPSAPDDSAAIASNPRLQMLRRSLDAQGYGGVHFKMDGGTIVLWGTVQNETDRIMVQSQVYMIAGIFSIEDHLQVRDGFGEP